MTDIHTRGVQVDHAEIVRASALAWPLRHACDFAENHRFCYDPIRHAPLERDLARWAVGAEVHSAARAVWTGQPVSVLDTLRAELERRLRYDGRWLALHPRRGPDVHHHGYGHGHQRDPSPGLPGREIVAWRWLSLLLPTTALAGLRMAGDDPSVPTPTRVRLLDPSLMPPPPLAHLHVHTGADRDFAGMWSHLHNVSVSGWWVGRRRRTMATALRRLSSEDPTFDAAVADHIERWPGLFLLREWWLRELTCLDDDAAIELLMSTPKCPFVRRRDGDRDAAVERATVERAALLCAWREGDAQGAAASPALPARWRLDAVASRRKPCSDAFAQEANLVRRLARAAERAPEVAPLVVRYLRAQTAVWRLLVCAPHHAGLTAFSNVNGRHQVLLRALPPTRRDSADGDEPGALRWSSRELRSSGLPRVRARAPSRAPSSTEVGHLLHFRRREVTRAKTGSDRTILLDGWRQGWLGRASQARTAVCNLRRDPEWLRSFRGLDVAGVESREPTALFAHAIHQVREASAVAAACGAPDLRAIRLTLHVGEDYVHLASGLRAIDDPIRWGLLQRGDRLGHARALGLAPDAWVDAHPEVWVPRIDRILDLLWLHRLTNTWGDHGSAYAARAELARLLGDVLPNRPAIEPDPLWDRLEQVMPALHTHGFPGPVHLSPGGDPALDVAIRLWSAWVDPQHHPDGPAGGRAIRARLDEPVLVITAADRPALTVAHRVVRDRVAGLLLAIEVCPSSNMVIGDLGGLVAQTAFHRQSAEGGDAATLPVTFSADDPLVLATDGEDELAYAWAWLVMGGCLPADARARVDGAAREAWRARFTLPPGP